MVVSGAVAGKAEPTIRHERLDCGAPMAGIAALVRGDRRRVSRFDLGRQVAGCTVALSGVMVLMTSEAGLYLRLGVQTDRRRVTLNALDFGVLGVLKAHVM
jgi:hypothetical protein